MFASAFEADVYVADLTGLMRMFIWSWVCVDCPRRCHVPVCGGAPRLLFGGQGVYLWPGRRCGIALWRLTGLDGFTSTVWCGASSHRFPRADLDALHRSRTWRAGRAVPVGGLAPAGGEPPAPAGPRGYAAPGVLVAGPVALGGRCCVSWACARARWVAFALGVTLRSHFAARSPAARGLTSGRGGLVLGALRRCCRGGRLRDLLSARRVRPRWSWVLSAIARILASARGFVPSLVAGSARGLCRRVPQLLRRFDLAQRHSLPQCQ